MKTVCFFSLLFITLSGFLVGGQEAGQEPDFPLATGEEAKLANARLLELFNAIMDETVELPSDMPSYREVPSDIQFTCADKLPGYYADVNYGCQVYHMCRPEPEHGVATFLCPNATVFHQEIFACDWWFNVDCSQAPNFFYLNEDLYKDPEVEEVGNEVARAQNIGPSASRPVRSPRVETKLSLPLNMQQFVIPVPDENQPTLGALNSEKSLTPVEGYFPPDRDYLPPKSDYLPPTGDYLPPPASGDYLPPTGDYLPPN